MESDIKLSEQGSLNAFGMDISISDIIGDKIVDQWMAQLTPEDMKLVYDAIEAEMFEHNYKDEKYFVKQRETNNSSYSWGNRTEDTPIWSITKRNFQQKYTDAILTKIDELLSTEKYQKQVEKVSEEIIQYALEGYKNDMIARIRERLVGNTLDSEPSYMQMNLRDIIRGEISNSIRYSN